MALALIFLMLFMTFGSPKLALLIYLNVPFAVTGGVFAMALRGIPLSISAGVGFIALFGVAVLNGLILVGYMKQRREEGASARERRPSRRRRSSCGPSSPPPSWPRWGSFPWPSPAGRGRKCRGRWPPS